MNVSTIMNSRSIVYRPAVVVLSALLWGGCAAKQAQTRISIVGNHPVMSDLTYPTFQPNGLETSWPTLPGSVLSSEDHSPLYYLTGALYQNGFVLKESVIQDDVQHKLLALSSGGSGACSQTHCASSMIGKNLPVELVYWSALLSLFENSSLMTESQAYSNGRGKFEHQNESLNQGTEEVDESMAQMAQRVRLKFYAAPTVKCAATMLLFSEDDQRHVDSATEWLVENGHRPPEWKLRQELGLDQNTGNSSIAFQQGRGPNGDYELNLLIVEADESPTGQAELNDIHLFCSSSQPMFAKDMTAYSVSGMIDDNAGWRVWVGSN